MSERGNGLKRTGLWAGMLASIVIIAAALLVWGDGLVFSQSEGTALQGKLEAHEAWGEGKYEEIKRQYQELKDGQERQEKMLIYMMIELGINPEKVSKSSPSWKVGKK